MKTSGGGDRRVFRYSGTAPTLILWGGEDGICDHADQVRLADTIPAARLSVLAGAGHAPHWEDPSGIATMTAAFLEAARAAA